MDTQINIKHQEYIDIFYVSKEMLEAYTNSKFLPDDFCMVFTDDFTSIMGSEGTDRAVESVVVGKTIDNTIYIDATVKDKMYIARMIVHELSHIYLKYKYPSLDHQETSTLMYSDYFCERLSLSTMNKYYGSYCGLDNLINYNIQQFKSSLAQIIKVIEERQLTLDILHILCYHYGSLDEIKKIKNINYGIDSGSPEEAIPHSLQLFQYFSSSYEKETFDPDLAINMIIEIFKKHNAVYDPVNKTITRQD